MSPCGECGAATTWDDQVCSLICTACGTLVDSTQSILTSHQDLPDSARQYNSLWNPSSSSTLKSFRTGNGWDLTGQGKEATLRKNTYAMHEFIKSISSSLSAPGISPRAITLFSQAMSAGHYRWGRRAKLVAAASIAIAFRESHKPDCLRDIAFLIDEPLSSISHTFSSVITMLKLVLPSVDPALHLPVLLSHLSTLIQPLQPPSPLPTPLLTRLTSLLLNNVLATANSLSSLIARVSDSIPLTGLPTPSTACALLMLALEAEARTSLPNLTDLAKHLAVRFDIGKGAVMSRYKVIYDFIEGLIRELPWLDKFEVKKGRSKVSKRSVVARGLKDVVQFQEEIWMKKLKALEGPKIALEEVDDDQPANLTDEDTPKHPELPPPRKKQKTRHALDAASLFLLDPLSAPLPPHPQMPNQLGLPYTSYLLAASSSSLSLRALPTRLQLLAVARGGSGAIDDEELFDEGEWENMVRSDEEMEKLRLLWCCDEDDDGAGEEPGKKERTKTKKIARGTNGGSERVDMTALHRLLQKTGETLDVEDEDLKGFEDEFAFATDQCFDLNEESDVELPTFPAANRHHIQDIEELEEWRPLSPGGAGRSDVGGRYDEEW